MGTLSPCLKCVIKVPGSTLIFLCRLIFLSLALRHFSGYIILKRISKFLARDKLETILQAFVTSGIDYCNGLLYMDYWTRK